MFSSTTMASSTTKPVEIVSAISDRLLRLNPSRYITPNEPMIEVGTATLGIAAARTLRKKANTTRITRRTAITSVFSVSVQRLPDGLRPIDGHGEVDVARQRGDQAGQLGSNVVDRLDDVGARLARQNDRDPRLAVDKTGVTQIFDGIEDFGDVGEPDRRAVAVGDHQIAILRRMGRLVVGVDLIVVVVVLDRALWTIGVGGGERGADVLKPNAVVEDRAGVDFDAHRRQRRAGDIDLADARKLRQPLLQNVGGEVIELPRGVGRRRHGDDHDRRVSRIDFMVGRILSQAGRQIDPRRDDGRLDVSRRAIDVAIKAELEGDAGRAERALRRHLVDVGDLAQVPLERRGDRGRHRVGARARHIRLNRDDRKVDLRQRRNRQLRIAEQSAEHDSDREQNRRDGPANEELGKPVVHGVSVASVAAVWVEPMPSRSPRRSKKR